MINKQKAQIFLYLITALSAIWISLKNKEGVSELMHLPFSGVRNFKEIINC